MFMKKRESNCKQTKHMLGLFAIRTIRANSLFNHRLRYSHYFFENFRFVLGKVGEDFAV